MIGFKNKEAIPDPASEKFGYPVDTEHKALQVRLDWVKAPHYLNFHITWVCFLISFLATFAPAALVPVIREDMNLTRTELGTAGACAVAGAVACRIGMGTVLDVVGGRMGTSMTLLLFAPAVFLIALVKNAASFAVVRLLIGCSLAIFVCCQFIVGSMFNVKIVGTANAIAAGWGNMGGGVVHFVIPPLYEGIAKDRPHFEAWRWAFMFPGALFLAAGMACQIMARDSPDGDYRDLKAAGKAGSGGKHFWGVCKAGLGNYRTWIMFLNYGYCFGVELTVDNVIVEYFYDQFEMSHTVAGALGGMFGLMNLFSRASGGLLSDICGEFWGMRGRLWVHWFIQTMGGVFCLAMGMLPTNKSGTIATMIIFSIFCQQACGSSFGIAPFISRRAYGVVSGVVGAGGNVGAIVTQVIFFAGSPYSPVMSKPDGLKWMGIMIIAVTATLAFIHFPMWGSMFLSGDGTTTEEDYYLREWTAEEIAQGLHTPSMRFAMESRSQRGSKAAAAYNQAISSQKGIDASQHGDEKNPAYGAPGTLAKA